MIYSAAQLSAISRLFSSAVFRELAERGRSPLFSRLIRQIYGQSIQEHYTVGHAFDHAFSELRRSGFRDEYIYRSALTQNILLGRHSLKTASLLSEFRIGPCKADLIILNGTSTAYEIKSERDSLARLKNQVSSYGRVCAKVYVIASEDHLDAVMDAVPEHVGILSLARWNRIQTVRDAVDGSSEVCPGTIFESIRTSEAVEILQMLGHEVPDLPNTLMWRALRAEFAKLDPSEVHGCMVKVLKRTRSQAQTVSSLAALPASLRSAALSVQVKSGGLERLARTVSTPLNEAMGWA